MDFKRKKIIKVGDTEITLQMWDTAGQERSRTMCQAYYKNGAGVILTYDMTDHHSFDQVENWLEQINTHCVGPVAKVLIGNKCDRQDRVVQKEKGETLAKMHGIGFFETSAKQQLTSMPLSITSQKKFSKQIRTNSIQTTRVNI